MILLIYIKVMLGKTGVGDHGQNYRVILLSLKWLFCRWGLSL